MLRKEPNNGSKRNPAPFPILWVSLSEGEISTHRYLQCNNYTRCLNWAARLNPPGFTCFYCELNPSRFGSNFESNEHKLEGGELRKLGLVMSCLKKAERGRNQRVKTIHLSPVFGPELERFLSQDYEVIINEELEDLELRLEFR